MPTMWAILTLPLAAGAALALSRLKVWALFLATVLLSLVAAAASAILGLTFGSIAIIVLAVAMVCQISYLTVAAIAEIQVGHRTAQRIPSKTELLRYMQVAIAEELRAYYEAPLNEIPPQLRNKLARLDSR